MCLFLRSFNRKAVAPGGEKLPPFWREERIIFGRHPVYFKTLEKGKIFVAKTNSPDDAILLHCCHTMRNSILVVFAWKPWKNAIFGIFS